MDIFFSLPIPVGIANAPKNVMKNDDFTRAGIKGRDLILKALEHAFFYFKNFTFRTAPGIRQILECNTG